MEDVQCPVFYRHACGLSYKLVGKAEHSAVRQYRIVKRVFHALFADAMRFVDSREHRHGAFIQQGQIQLTWPNENTHYAVDADEGDLHSRFSISGARLQARQAVIEPAPERTVYDCAFEPARTRMPKGKL